MSFERLCNYIDGKDTENNHLQTDFTDGISHSFGNYAGKICRISGRWAVAAEDALDFSDALGTDPLMWLQIQAEIDSLSFRIRFPVKFGIDRFLALWSIFETFDPNCGPRFYDCSRVCGSRTRRIAINICISV